MKIQKLIQSPLAGIATAVIGYFLLNMPVRTELDQLLHPQMPYMVCAVGFFAMLSCIPTENRKYFDAAFGFFFAGVFGLFSNYAATQPWGQVVLAGPFTVQQTLSYALWLAFVASLERNIGLLIFFLAVTTLVGAAIIVAIGAKFIALGYGIVCLGALITIVVGRGAKSRYVSIITLGGGIGFFLSIFASWWFL